MKYCKKCLQPDTRPGIMFNEEGICYACLYEEEKKNIDWKQRELRLMSIANRARDEKKRRGNLHDCVIGVSGGKDSTYQAVYAKEKLGLNRLLVNCFPDGITDVGRHNLDNLGHISNGFDMLSIRNNPIVSRKLAKKSFFEKSTLK